MDAEIQTVAVGTRMVPLDAIDDPYIAMRETVDDDDLDELMEDLRKNGLIQPITVRKLGERYEVIAGHRRTRSARLLNWATIEAKVIEADDDKSLALRLAENLMRKDVDPVDEAVYIGEIMTRYKKTVEEVAQIVGKRIDWVERRLAVFDMPDYLQHYLKLRRFSIEAAIWINKLQPEAERRTHADWAGVNGVSAAGAKRWYEDLAARNFQPRAIATEIEDPASGQVRNVTLVRCHVCKDESPVEEMNGTWVHPKC